VGGLILAGAINFLVLAKLNGTPIIMPQPEDFEFKVVVLDTLSFSN
jgi:hypothetical protein